MSHYRPAIKALPAILAFFVSAFVSVAPISAHEFNGSASITILQSLAVSEETPLDFGYIHRPSVGENTFTLNPLDNSVSTNGTGDAQLVEGTATSGVYAVKGAPEQPIQVSVSIADFADPAITVQEAHVNGPTSTANGVLDADGNYKAHVGAVITIGADAALGTHSTDIMVTVSYE